MTLQQASAVERFPAGFDPSRLRNAMPLLFDASNCARHIGKDVWEFAVELDALQAAGLSGSHLRWLICQRFVRHADEVPRTHGLRKWRRRSGLCLSSRTCFILTPEGEEFLRSWSNGDRTAARQQPEGTPVWDGRRRELRVGSAIVKRFQQPASNQELVLAAFQEEEWPPRIFDPLPPVRDQDTKRRLHSTINNLNRGHDQPILRFHGGGDGLSISWRLLKS
jgi:hypothetical protein